MRARLCVRVCGCECVCVCVCVFCICIYMYTHTFTHSDTHQQTHTFMQKHPPLRRVAGVLQRVAGVQLACYTPASSRVSREVLATRLQKHPPLRNYHKFSQGILKMFIPSLFPLVFLFFFSFFYICSSSDVCIFFFARLHEKQFVLAQHIKDCDRLDPRIGGLLR